MAKNRIAGTITIFANGKQLTARGAFTWSVQGTMRETKTGPGEVAGFSETAVAAFIEGPVTLTRDVNMAFLNSISEHTIQLDLADGRSVVLEEAWMVNQLSGDTGEGQATVRFESKSGREINNS